MRDGDDVRSVLIECVTEPQHLVDILPFKARKYNL